MKVVVAVLLSIFVLAGCAAPRQTAGPHATAVLRPASGSQVHGELTFTQVGLDRVRVVGEIAGHSTGPKGFHIHEKGDCSAPDATSAGGHFNPASSKHGSSTRTGHAGDMGNLTFNDSGKATIDTIVEGLSVSTNAPNGIIGRAVVVHMQADDLKTDPAGNAGERAACGVIT